MVPIVVETAQVNIHVDKELLVSETMEIYNFVFVRGVTDH
jgi:hypothetical protein